MIQKEKSLREHWKKANAVETRFKKHAEIKANSRNKLKNLGSVQNQKIMHIIQSLQHGESKKY